MIYIFEAFNSSDFVNRLNVGGSHRQLVELLLREYECESFTLCGKKWHWKMRYMSVLFSIYRTGGLLLAREVPECLTVSEKDVVFATSSFSLCELLCFRPAFLRARKVCV